MDRIFQSEALLITYKVTFFAKICMVELTTGPLSTVDIEVPQSHAKLQVTSLDCFVCHLPFAGQHYIF